VRNDEHEKNKNNNQPTMPKERLPFGASMPLE